MDFVKLINLGTSFRVRPLILSSVKNFKLGNRRFNNYQFLQLSFVLIQLNFNHWQWIL